MSACKTSSLVVFFGTALLVPFAALARKKSKQQTSFQIAAALSENYDVSAHVAMVYEKNHQQESRLMRNGEIFWSIEMCHKLFQRQVF